MREIFVSASSTEKNIPIIPVITKQFESWISKQSDHIQQWVKISQFLANSSTYCLIPNSDGSLQTVLLGMNDPTDYYAFAGLAEKLPQGVYAIQETECFKTPHFYLGALGWGCGFYQFAKYKKPLPRAGKLLLHSSVDEKFLTDTLKSIYLARDLINTPAEDMGPEQIENAVKNVAKEFSATVEVMTGDALEKNYPAIHTVGRASPRAPRMIDMRWGNKDAPKITLVGKGVCFDSGGLDIKSAAGMILMKKDMGGAAMMLSLAQLIMSQQLPVQLRLLIGTVDNAISGNSYRPGDIIRTRAGKSIEVTNTDAEGRLVLCDMLFEASQENPDILIDFATLTGAARVALGEEISAMFAQTQSTADGLLKAAAAVTDPIWQMPLIQKYRENLRSEIADMTNCSDSPYGGSITAALFLQSFVKEDTNWVHFDTCSWNARYKPGRLVGAEVYGVRAVFEYLKNKFN
jgi:leucyl aminopeptidase